MYATPFSFQSDYRNRYQGTVLGNWDKNMEAFTKWAWNRSKHRASAMLKMESKLTLEAIFLVFRPEIAYFDPKIDKLG